MVASARRKRITEFSITEHVSQFRELRETVRFGSLHTTGRIFEDLKEYEMEFEKIQDIGEGTRVHRGLEVDFSLRFKSKVAEFVKRARWDIVLLSVHEFGNTRDIEKESSETAKHTPYSRWREYFELEKTALEFDSLPFQVLAHPVRMSRGIDPHPADVDDLFLELATIAEERGKALELNGKDFDYAPELVRRLATACAKARCKVSLGSDAHHPAEVFQNLDAAQALINELRLEQFVPKGHYGTRRSDNLQR